jgi:REP element-mobilizing transposase RayT
MSTRHWFLTWTTYGTWLPGDERGFVGSVVDGDGPRIRHNEPGTPCDASIPALRQAAQLQMKQSPVWLIAAQAVAVGEQFHETARYRNWELLVFSIMTNHVHLVVTVLEDPDPELILGSFKSYASRRLNQQRGTKQNWWTESGSKRRVREANLPAVVRYVRDQEGPLVMWIAPAWQAELERIFGERPAQGERGASAP